jgi:hypothetical protein
VIVFSDRTLKAAGLDFAMARALLSPGESELVVHVLQVLDHPPAPYATHGRLDEVTHQGPDARYSFPVIPPCATDSLSVYTPQQSVYTPGAQEPGQPVLDQDLASGRQAAPPAVRDLGKDSLEEVQRDARRLAATYGCDLLADKHGTYTLVTRTGNTTHASLHAAIKSLKPPTEYLIERLDAIPAAGPGAGHLDMPLDVEIPVLPERGAVSPEAIRHVAGLLGCQVQVSGACVMVTGAHGCHTFVGWSKVAAALNRRSFTGKFYD